MKNTATTTIIGIIVAALVLGGAYLGISSSNVFAKAEKDSNFVRIQSFAYDDFTDDSKNATYLVYDRNTNVVYYRTGSAYYGYSYEAMIGPHGKNCVFNGAESGFVKELESNQVICID